MKKLGHAVVLAAGIFCAAAGGASAQTVRHVWTNSPFPGAPYNAWTNAARTIQEAIDAADAAAGDWVWVTNGVFDTGGRPAPAAGAGTNRVVINKPIRVQAVSANPVFAVIRGARDPVASSNGPAAIRCVYITNDAALIGFTLTGGATITVGVWQATAGGGAWCQSSNSVISNCVLASNMAVYAGASYQGALRGCLLEGNYASGHGGAVYGPADLYNCRFIGNKVWGYGGGAHSASLYDCALVGNTSIGAGSGQAGGAASSSVLRRCTVEDNTSRATLFFCATHDSRVERNVTTYTLNGGAAYNCVIADNMGAGAGLVTLYNCALTGNSASTYGGGAADSTLYNCLLSGNIAGAGAGGGAWNSALYNCTVTRNTGYGVYQGSVWNSIIFNNRSHTAVSNYNFLTEIHFSCTAPLPGAGAGNIDADPVFVDPGAGYGTNHVPGNYRLQRRSPCMNTGMNRDYMTNPAVLATNEWLGKDIDGGPRIRHNAVDMGAFERRIPVGSVFSAE